MEGFDGRVWLKYHIGTSRWPAASLLSLPQFSNIERKSGWLQPSAVLPAKQPSSKVLLGNCKSSCSRCTYAAGNVQALVSSNEASIGLAAPHRRSRTYCSRASTTSAVMLVRPSTAITFKLMVELAGNEAMQSGGVQRRCLVYECVPFHLIAAVGIAF